MPVGEKEAQRRAQREALFRPAQPRKVVALAVERVPEPGIPLMVDGDLGKFQPSEPVDTDTDTDEVERALAYYRKHRARQRKARANRKAHARPS